MTRKISPLLFIVCMLLFSIVSAAGCAPSRASLQKSIDDLEKKVAQLKTERVNLEARSGALDDRVLVLQAKLNRCRQDTMPLLKVVKLSPEPAQEEPVSEPEETAIEPVSPDGHATVKEDATRPRLVLQADENQGFSTVSSSVPVSSGDHFGFGADNLGVVDQSAATENDRTLESFHAAYLAYSNRKYEEALAAFSELIKADPQHSYADNAVFWRGECYLATGDFFKAIGEFERLLHRYPNSEMAPSSLYRIGFAYDQLNDRPKAVEYYFQVVDRYPESDAARRASRRVSAIEGNAGQANALMPTAVKR